MDGSGWSGNPRFVSGGMLRRGVLWFELLWGTADGSHGRDVGVSRSAVIVGVRLRTRCAMAIDELRGYQQPATPSRAAHPDLCFVRDRLVHHKIFEPGFVIRVTERRGAEVVTMKQSIKAREFGCAA